LPPAEPHAQADSAKHNYAKIWIAIVAVLLVGGAVGSGYALRPALEPTQAVAPSEPVPQIEAKPETPSLTTAARPAAAREEAKAAVVESTPPETPKAAAPVSAKPQPVTPATVAADPPAPVQTPPYLIQLVSVKSNAAASWEWTRLQKLFAGLEPFIQKTVIKKRGTFNRLRADGFSSKRQAAACRSLKTKGQSCLVVKR